MIRAVVLDMDGVIRHLDLKTAEKASQSIGFSYTELMDVLWYNEPARELLCGRSTREDWWKQVQPLDPRLEGVSQDILWNDVFERSYIDQEVIEFMIEAQRKYTTGILTNCDRESKVQIIDELELNHPFDYVLSSSDIGTVKPEREVFLGLLERIGVESRDCLFFDDSTANVEGARAVGIKAHLYEGLTHLKKIVGI